MQIQRLMNYDSEICAEDVRGEERCDEKRHRRRKAHAISLNVSESANMKLISEAESVRQSLQLHSSSALRTMYELITYSLHLPFSSTLTAPS